MIHRFGVRYPNGTWSGPISPTAKDLKPYARLHHGTIYEVGSADDPGRLCQRKGEPWVFDDDPPRYQGDSEADAAADRADAENDRRKCDPDGLAAKFGPLGGGLRATDLTPNVLAA